MFVHESDICPQLAHVTQGLSSHDDRQRSIAFKDLLSLADAGDGDAMFQVAVCLQQGIGAEADTKSADRWLRLSCVAKPASRLAQYTYGMQHLLNQRPDADAQKGITFIERAASQGHVNAVLTLLDVIENGRSDLKPDLRRAYRLVAGSLPNDKDGALHAAYMSFIERHSPINSLLDS